MKLQSLTKYVAIATIICMVNKIMSVTPFFRAGWTALTYYPQHTANGTGQLNKTGMIFSPQGSETQP